MEKLLMEALKWKDHYDHKLGGWNSTGKTHIQHTILHFYLTLTRLSGKSISLEKMDRLKHFVIPFLTTRLQFTYKSARRSSKNIRFRIKPT